MSWILTEEGWVPDDSNRELVLMLHDENGRNLQSTYLSQLPPAEQSTIMVVVGIDFDGVVCEYTLWKGNHLVNLGNLHAPTRVNRGDTLTLEILALVS